MTHFSIKIMNESQYIEQSHRVINCLRDFLSGQCLLNSKNFNKAKYLFSCNSFSTEDVKYCLAKTYQSLANNKIYFISGKNCSLEPTNYYLSEAEKYMAIYNVSSALKASDLYIESKENKVEILF